MSPLLSIEQLLILILLLSCTLCQAWQRNRVLSPPLWKKWPIKSISISAASVLLGWGLPSCLDLSVSLPHLGSAAVVVHADSTGKVRLGILSFTCNLALTLTYANMMCVCVTLSMISLVQS